MYCVLCTRAFSGKNPLAYKPANFFWRFPIWLFLGMTEHTANKRVSMGWTGCRGWGTWSLVHPIVSIPWVLVLGVGVAMSFFPRPERTVEDNHGLDGEGTSAQAPHRFLASSSRARG